MLGGSYLICFLDPDNGPPVIKGYVPLYFWAWDRVPLPVGQPVEKKTRSNDPTNNYLIFIQSIFNPPYIICQLLPVECELGVESSSKRCEIGYLLSGFIVW